MSATDDFPIKTDRVAEGEFKGIRWIAARAPLYNAVNGYIRLPDGHPWFEIEYIENGIPWGEITFGRGNWIGFDSLHSGQYWPDSRYGPMAHDTLMTDGMVIEWTKQLALEAHRYVESGQYII